MWCSNQQPLHCAFSLERYSPATAQLSCKISVRQVKGHEQILQVYTAVAEVRGRRRRGWGAFNLCVTFSANSSAGSPPDGVLMERGGRSSSANEH